MVENWKFDDCSATSKLTLRTVESLALRKVTIFLQLHDSILNKKISEQNNDFFELLTIPDLPLNLPEKEVSRLPQPIRAVVQNQQREIKNLEWRINQYAQCRSTSSAQIPRNLHQLTIFQPKTILYPLPTLSKLIVLLYQSA